MSSNTRTLEITVSDAFVAFVDRVYRNEIENAPAYKPFQVGDDSFDPDTAEKAFTILMADHPGVVCDIRQERGLLRDNESEEAQRTIRAYRVPEGWLLNEDTPNLKVARVRKT